MKPLDVVRIKGVNSSRLKAYGVVESVSLFIKLLDQPTSFYKDTALEVVEPLGTPLQDKIKILDSVKSHKRTTVVAHSDKGNITFDNIDSIPLSMVDNVFFVDTHKIQLVL